MALPKTLQQFVANPNFSPQKSSKWLNDTIQRFFIAPKFSTQRFLGDLSPVQARGTGMHHVGKMIQFFYSPKHKATLPIYDTFPLVLPFSYHGKYMTGINLHYLQPDMRFALLSRLGVISGNTPQRLAISWSFLQTLSKHVKIEGAVKMYILHNVKSNFIVFPKEEYMNVIYLPSERWVEK